MADDEGIKKSDEELAELIVRLNQAYAQAAYELTVKFNKYMADFQRKDTQKQQDLAAGLISDDEYKRWRLGQILIGHRWQEMVDTMTADLVKVDQFAMAMVSDTSLNVFAVNHNYATFEVEQGSALNTSYTLYNKDTVAYLVRKQPSLLPMPRVDIPKDQVWNRQHLASAILQGVMQGESIGKIANRVQAVADMDRKAALRNARTMVTCAQNAGRQAAYERGEKKGIHGVKMWVAAHDERVRASHAAIDGERVPVNEKFSNGLMFPGDKNGAPAEVYNCRCAMVRRVGHVDLKAYVKNKPEEQMSYKEWNNAHQDLPYVDETEKWKENAKNNQVKIKDATDVVFDGVSHKIDGKNILWNYKPHEKAGGELLSKMTGREVVMQPEVKGKYKNIKWPDYLVGEERWDLKNILQGKTDEVLRNIVHKKKKQADYFIFDITEAPLTEADWIEQAANLFSYFNTTNVECVVLIKNGEIVKVFKKKK